MTRDYYRTHTPGSGRAAAEAPAHSRRTEEMPYDDFQHPSYRAHTPPPSYDLGGHQSRPLRTEGSPYAENQRSTYRPRTPGQRGDAGYHAQSRRAEEVPYDDYRQSIHRSRTPGPGHSNGGHARPYDDYPSVSYVSALPPGRNTLDDQAHSRRSDELPYDEYRGLSLGPSQIHDADRNTRSRVQDGPQYPPPEHNDMTRPATHLRSRSIGPSHHANERRSSYIPPDIVPEAATQRYTEYDYRDESPRRARDQYRRDTAHAHVEQDHRERSTRRQSTNENMRPRATSTGPPRRDDKSAEGPVPRGERPEYLIVGLFSLRLARRLIEKLNAYPERSADLAWLDNFLSYYAPDDDLAELRSYAMDDFAKTYPVIIHHFIKQPKFPIAFMQMDPTPRGRETRRLTDREARDMVDFADAAAEWGSSMKLPGQERERMEALAARRKIARGMAV